MPIRVAHSDSQRTMNNSVVEKQPVVLSFDKSLPLKPSSENTLGTCQHSQMTDSTEEASQSSDFHPEEQLHSVEEEKSDEETASTRSVRRRSILKMSENEEIPVKEGRFSWKQLPKLDMEKIRRASAPTSSTCVSTEPQTEPQQRRATVTFDAVRIRSYEQTIGDNPSVSYGPPISLDWDYEEHDPLALDEYEEFRGVRRKPRQMMLNYYNRRNLLMWKYGHSEEELKQAKSEANKIKRSRSFTKALLPAQKLEEIVQSAARKTKRLSGKR